MLRLLAGVSLLLLTAKASSTGRELLVDTSINTVGVCCRPSACQAAGLHALSFENFLSLQRL